MEYRKLIKFGNSSYVVSLPKAWVIKHRLKKGAIIYVDENKVGDLVCSPKEVEEEPPKTFVLNVDEHSPAYIKRELVSAYINNFQHYQIVAKQPFDQPRKLKELLTSFIGIEVMEESKNKIVAKDFVDIRMISVEELLKKVHLLVKTMFADLKDFNQIHMESRIEEIERIFFLARKIVLYNLNNPALMKLDKKTVHDFMIMREMAYILKELGDLLNYISDIFLPYKKEEISEVLFSLLDESYVFYDQLMKIYFQKDWQAALKHSERKSNFKGKIDSLFETNTLPDKDQSGEKVTGMLYVYFTSLIKKINLISRVVYTSTIREDK
ncbi:hypothetical protein CL622_03470 [archaeon]|nr:hypothetical protein [archaeon]|tara:strand:+ start:3273 stop:4244 length:972 start_codon:yes stop_codon:yes gene_type:complete